MIFSKIKKIKHYKDIGLLIDVFFSGMKIIFLYKLGKSKSLLKMVSAENSNIRLARDKDTIMSYVGFFTGLKNRCRIKDTCYTYSVLAVHMLRKNSIPARIYFGARKNESLNQQNPTQGHCWVSTDDKNEVNAFKEVFSYP